MAVDSSIVTGAALESSSSEIILMPNGCICCKVRGDLVEALRKVAMAGVDGIIIECSGLAECAPVAQTFFLDTFVQATLQLDGIVCVCDCHASLSDGEREVAQEQLALADVVLLNKATDANAPPIRDWVCSINSTAKVIVVPEVVSGEQMQLQASQIVGIEAFALDKACLTVEGFGEEEHSHSHHEHQHDKLGYRSVGMQCSQRALNWQRTREWLLEVCHKNAEAMCRFKVKAGAMLAS